MSARRFKPYPEYKDSGVEWLGEIPACWDVKRLRFLSESNPVASEARGLPGETEVSFVPMEAVGEHGGLSLEMTKQLADVKAGYTYFRDGDIVIAKITPCFENGKGSLAAGLTNGIAFGTTELHVLRMTERADRRFMFYVTQSDAFRRLGEADMYGAGGQKRVSESFVRNFSHALPPVPEQGAIGAFLDRETSSIDALVAKKERLIELLHEQRTALITRAVTKGLDPNVAMKDSGVEWLGEIPAQWDVKRLRHALSARPRNGISPPIGPVGDVPTFSTAAVSDGEVLIDENLKYTTLEQREALPYIVAIGDIFLLRGSGSRKIVGRAGVLKEQPPTGCIYPDILIRVQPSRLVTPWFLVNSLNSAAVRFQIESLAQTASGIWKISGEDVRSLVLAVPPYDEQLAIQGEVSQHTAKLDALTLKVGNAIDSLKELRSALISAAVTGKIDVRGISADASVNQGGVA